MIFRGTGTLILNELVGIAVETMSGLTSPLMSSYTLLSWYLKPVAGSVYGAYKFVEKSRI